MIKEVKLPEVSDNVETGDVVKVLVSVGDQVKVDQPIIELETDKAMFEVPSTEEGVVKEIKVKVGDAIGIGSVILTLDSEGDGEKKKEPDNEGQKKNEDKKVQNEDPENKEKVETKSEDKQEKEEGSEEKKEEGSEEKKEEGTEEEKKEDTEGTKKSPEEETEKDSKETGLKSQKKDVKEESAKKDEDKEEKTKNEKEVKKGDTKEKADEKVEAVPIKDTAPASPSVRRLARELGVDINEVTGSGPGGRISEDDIKKFVKEKIGGSTGGGVSVSHKALQDFEKWGEIEREPISKVRAITGEVMTYAWTTIPMVTQFDKADITQIEEFRKKYSKKVEEEGGHLTVTSLLVKIASAALKAFPQFNSSIDFANKEIIFKKYFNIGIAVDTDRGLLVPVIKDTDKKNVTEISSELNELAEKARNKKISPDEMDGGNFTISNLGGIGGTGFTPIVYSPQVAILGVSRANKEPVLINERFEPRFMLPLTLTYDHRIIDGADAARFLRWISEALENPMVMVL